LELSGNSVEMRLVPGLPEDCARAIASFMVGVRRPHDPVVIGPRERSKRGCPVRCRAADVHELIQVEAPDGSCCRRTGQSTVQEHARRHDLTRRSPRLGRINQQMLPGCISKRSLWPSWRSISALPLTLWLRALRRAGGTLRLRRGLHCHSSGLAPHLPGDRLTGLASGS